MSPFVRRSPRASVHPRLGCPVVCGVRLGQQCIGTGDVPGCVPDIIASALGISRCVWRSPRASVLQHSALSQCA
eukprot:1104659-Alexandrium_andersonii.AAC.1